jgi:hypothetical protein
MTNRRTVILVATAIVGVLAIGAAVFAFLRTTSGPTVVTFEVAGYPDETYKIELATPELIQHVKQLMAGEEVARIPNGLVVRDDPGVNAPWSWHIDPSSLAFADVTTEVCDGLPSFVENDEVTSPYFCPWETRIVDLTGPGS